MKGLSVEILRNDLGDSTNGGVSSPKHSGKRILVVFDEAFTDGNFDLEECRGDPRFVCLQIVRRWTGTENEYLHVEPMFDQPEGMAGPSFGGNYVMGDSRFRRIARYPLPVHDRFETWEHYRALSR